jgi:8-oxo-dGTP diphosphatase
MPVEKSEADSLFFILFFLVFFFRKVPVLSCFFVGFFVLFFFFIKVIGDEVEVDGMRLRNFEFGLALGTAENLALFDFVFIDIDFGRTFRAADHGSILRKDLHAASATYPATPAVRVLYTAFVEVNSCAWLRCFERNPCCGPKEMMASSREYPDRPIVGVGGVIIDKGRTLLIRRGSEPLRGEWSIPGGTLELGETLAEGVARELLEETGLVVRVLEQIEVFERIYGGKSGGTGKSKKRPRFHYVIVDYLCECVGGEAHAGSDVTDVAYAREDELDKFHLTETALRILRKAFVMDRALRATR